MAHVPRDERARIALPLGIWPQGVPRGAVVLVGGAPGAGKSTLALQLAAALAQENVVLYVSAEEPLSQVRARGDRLGLTAPQLHVLAESVLPKILAAAESLRPAALVLDSVQMLTARATDVPGAPAVLREVVVELVRWAQRTGTVVLAISQAPKRGGFTGPRLLEHIVDAALYLEPTGENGQRVLHVIKNRYGPAPLALALRMTAQGLEGLVPSGRAGTGDPRGREAGSEGAARPKAR